MHCFERNATSLSSQHTTASLYGQCQSPVKRCNDPKLALLGRHHQTLGHQSSDPSPAPSASYLPACKCHNISGSLHAWTVNGSNNQQAEHEQQLTRCLRPSPPPPLLLPPFLCGPHRSHSSSGTWHEIPTGGAWYLNNVCEQLSVGDTFLDNSAQQGGAVAILNPAISSGRYILSVQPAGGSLVLPTILRLPCGVNSAVANATFERNKAAVSGGAMYAVSTPVVRLFTCWRSCPELLLGLQVALQGLYICAPGIAPKRLPSACNADLAPKLHPALGCGHQHTSRTNPTT